MKRSLISMIAMLSMSAAALSQPAEDQGTVGAIADSEVKRIHERVLTLDTHVDIPLNYASLEMDPGGLTTGQVDLPKMRAGGLDAAFFIVYTPQGELTNDGFAQAQHIARTRMAAIDRMLAAYPDQVTMARKAKQVARIARKGRRVALVGMENAYPLGPTANQVEWWRDRGVRYVGITHFGHNQFGDSSNPNVARGDPEELHGGLSDLGRELVRELNRLGVMVDVSHAGKKTMLQAAEASAAPIIASHSGVKALAESPRNLDDEQLRALAENGGVVQIVALDVYLKPLNKAQTDYIADLRKKLGLETSEKIAAALPSILKAYTEGLEKRWEIEPRASVSDLVDHIDHVVKIAGIDHVGIASDFDGGGGIDGWEDATQTINVTRELLQRGYSEKEIEKIWGGNLLRVMRSVEKKAKALDKI